jgi:hypothetical protein
MAVLFVVNGFRMLVTPLDWFEAVPGVVNTGEMNAHFVKDLGVLFLVMAAGMGWALVRPSAGYVVHLGITAWLVGHAIVHVAEIGSGILPHEHWRLDALGVFLPAVLTVLLAFPPVWRRFAGIPIGTQVA